MSKLRIYPFGGVAEIGSNMTVFETESKILVIDYGILFPYDDFFNLNYLIADTTQLNQEKEIILFITHGHEDHIGAITHFLTEIPQAKVYAPRLARELILFKLQKQKMSHEITLYDEDFQLNIDEYTLHPVHVTHSIPDTFGIIFKNNDLAVLFISDFKFDLKPLFEKPFNYQKIQALFKGCKQTLAMIDSTNILSPGKTTSESELSRDLEEIIKRKKRTFITLFSSNLYRLKNILELCKKNSKRVVSIGRSINHYLETAHNVGLINLDDYPFIDFDGVQNYQDPNIVYIVTGSQGEYLGAAKRIITGNQKNIQLNEDDQFVFSSKPIPGNEKKIYQLYNILAEYNIDPITFKDANIHASGHPCQEDLKQLIEKVNPTHYIPIHGETYFLRKHIDFIQENFPKISPIYLTNFSGIEFNNGKIKSIEFEEVLPHIIHGNGLELERERISERRKIADNGSVFISLNHKKETISLSTKGLPMEFDQYHLKLKDIIDYCAFVENKKRDHDYTIEQVRIKVRNFINSIIGYKPITIVHML